MKKIILLISLVLICNPPLKAQSENISTIDILGNEVSDIRSISKQVTPYVYKSSIDLGNLNVQEKKQAFINLMIPSILIAKKELEEERARVLEINSKANDSSLSDVSYLNTLKKRYKCNSNSELLSRMRSHPTSIVLAQAAIESGWGTSRFYRQANNVFGVWSYRKDEPRIRASEDREGTSVYVKKYDSLPESIASYFKTLARGPYSEFRVQREKTKDVFTLTPHLIRYSELREVYVERVEEIIRYNQLEQYDSYELKVKY